jgi:hypothetical protein
LRIGHRCGVKLHNQIADQDRGSQCCAMSHDTGHRGAMVNWQIILRRQIGINVGA